MNSTMHDHFVITIGRQLGSGGREVGERIARRLGVSLYDRQLIDLAARECGLSTEIFEQADERQSGSLLTTLLGYLRAPFTGYEGGDQNNILAGEALFKVQSDVIRQIAERESCVVVGRCADYVLRDHPRLLNVFITARDEERIRRIREREACSEEQARERMERGDARRAAYYDYYSSRTWGAARSYDLCLDSSVLGIERTAEFVLRFAGSKLDLKY